MTLILPLRLSEQGPTVRIAVGPSFWLERRRSGDQKPGSADISVGKVHLDALVDTALPRSVIHPYVLETLKIQAFRSFILNPALDELQQLGARQRGKIRQAAISIWLPNGQRLYSVPILVADLAQYYPIHFLMGQDLLWIGRAPARA